MPEIKLFIKQSGEIAISIKHLDKSTDISEQALNVFLKDAITKGIQIKSVSSYCEIGNQSASFEQYEISVKK